MELLSRLKDVEPPRPEAFNQARMILGEAMANTARTDSARINQPTQIRARQRRFGGRRAIGFGAGIGLAAAAVAAALVITSTPTPSANTGHQSAGSKPSSVSASPKPTGASSSAPLAKNPQLMSLAAEIIADDGALSGNASLVLSKQRNNGVLDNVGYNLYTDSGDYYWSPTESGLPEVVAQHQNIANGVDSREKAAALYAVNGDLATAREMMVNATPNPFGLGLNAAGRKALLKKLRTEYNANLRNPVFVKAFGKRKFIGIPTGTALQDGIDNSIWNNSVNALTQAGGNPQIRAGVLRLLSTVSAVTVGKSTTGGKPSLTLTAGPAVFGGAPGDQVLMIDAKTGIPIRSVSGLPGQAPSSVVTFQVSRVTVADVEAGKF